MIQLMNWKRAECYGRWTKDIANLFKVEKCRWMDMDTQTLG